MITFTASIETLDIDYRAYNKAFDRNMEKQMKIAASKFLSAALKLIPTFNAPSGGRESDYSTGFVAGAFNNLKDAVGGYGTQTPTVDVDRVKSNVQQGKSPITEDVIKKLLTLYPTTISHEHKTIHELRSRSRTVHVNGRPVKIRINPYYYYPGGKILKTPQSARQFSTQPDKIFSRRGDTYSFNYEVDILYFSIQDVENIGRSHYAPWKAFEAGMNEFHKYMLSKDILRKVFPNIDDFVTKKTYTVNTNGGISIKRTKLGGLIGDL